MPTWGICGEDETAFSSLRVGSITTTSPHINRAPLFRKVTGSINPPPLAGGTIKAYELDTLGNRTGNTASLPIGGNHTFAIELPATWGTHAELVYTGRLFDLAAARNPTSVTQLSAIANTQTADPVSINVFSHWVATRLRLQSSKKPTLPLPSRWRLTQQDLAKKLTGISPKILASLNLFNEDTPKASITTLLFTGALQELAAANQRPLQALLDDISLDYASDSYFNDAGDFWLRQLQQHLLPNPAAYAERYATQLKDNFADYTVPNMENLPNVLVYASRPLVSELNHQLYALPGETVMLDASGSSDPDGGTLTYIWTQVDHGTRVNLDNRFSATPSFKMPDTTQSGTTAEPSLLFLLLVIDDEQIVDEHLVRVLLGQAPTEETEDVQVESAGHLEGQVSIADNLRCATYQPPLAGVLEINSLDCTYAYTHNGGVETKDSFIIGKYADSNGDNEINLTIDKLISRHQIQVTITPRDTDLDGIPDTVDNCPMPANTDQSDHEENGLGDACENARTRKPD